MKIVHAASAAVHADQPFRAREGGRELQLCYGKATEGRVWKARREREGSWQIGMLSLAGEDGQWGT